MLSVALQKKLHGGICVNDHRTERRCRQVSVQLYLCILFIVVIVTIIVSGFLSYYFYREEYKKRLDVDITKEQMLILEQRIDQFFQQYNMEPGESIYKIAEALNIVAGGTKEEINSRAKMNDPNEEGQMLVFFKRGLSGQEMLFDFAHECGHRINRDPTPVTRPEGYNKDVREQLADYVGAALLLPLENVYAYLEENNYGSSSRRKKRILIRGLCQKYGVSEMIALRRINEVKVIKGIK